MTLPGRNFIYNGEELGMLGLTEEELPKECQIDIQEDTRDICRNPMQWNRNQAQNYGFSDCDPVEDNQGWDNVHPQKKCQNGSFLQAQHYPLESASWLSLVGVLHLAADILRWTI